MWEFGEDGRSKRREAIASDPKTLSQALRADLVNGKMEHYLRYADRSSMAHSREIRLPFLSHDLVEFTLSVPAPMRFHDGWTKYLTRAAMDGVVPDSVRWRTDKVGFATPHEKWMASAPMAEIAGSAREFLIDEGIINRRWRDTGKENWEMTMAYFLVSGSASL
jgi:asparagine synthase (glutamine-hydrolysing)